MKPKFLVAFVLVVFSSMSFADFFDGNGLREVMARKSQADVGLFRGYVAGI
jgi:hypothetical protein